MKKERRLTPYTLTIQEMKDLAAKHNGKCLSESYQNIQTKLRWECSKGHKFEMTPATIKYQDAWCSICAKREKIKRIKDFKKDYYNIDQNKVKEFIQSRNATLISDYKNVTGKLLIVCENNHEFYMSLKDLRRGYWCKECKGIVPKEEKIKDSDLMHNLTIQLNLHLPDTQLKHIIYLCNQRISEIKEIEAVEALRDSELEELEELQGIINACEKAKYIKNIKNKNYTRPFILNNYQYK